MKLLLLGGTSEASALARALSARPDVAATLSLAGVTRRPAPAALATRRGGFGGAEGLIDYLRTQRIDAVVDATHPFAAQMSLHAAHGCRATGRPLLRLIRPPWQPGPGDEWHAAADLADAARRVAPLGARVFLTVGGRSLAPFAAVTGKHWLVRSIDAPDPPPAFAHWTLIRARGPFSLAAETALLREHAVDALVTKNSGSDATRAKLDAARALGVAVVMVQRPDLPAPDRAFTRIDEVLAWLDTCRGGHATNS